MAQVTVRNISGETHRRLKTRAKINNRSLEGEIREILEHAARPDRIEIARRLAELRGKQKPLKAGEIDRWIREDRDSH